MPLNLSFTGIAASASNPDVCHSKRFVARRDLQHMVLPNWEIEEMPGVPPDPDDVIMCAKQFWSDQTLAQKPVAVMPKPFLAKLQKLPSIVDDRTKMSEKTLKEYRKTAAKIDALPWNMRNAAEYLRTWCQDNEMGKLSEPLQLQWVVDNTKVVPMDEPAVFSDEWKRYAPQQAAMVTVRVQAPPATPRRSKRIPVGRSTPVKLLSERPVADEPGQDDIQLPDGDAEVPIGPGAEPAVAPLLPAPKRRRILGKGALESVGDQGASSFLVLGCARCRRNPEGCSSCRNPLFRGKRGPLP